ncbi:MAG: deoxyribodipyrimidine photo-lyase [Erysipelotrichaceae bacterium]|nr:MAG: deoxyribodipyrimidine [Erysipelotrichaceae bacterium]TXT16800.1 MAG: deoxyribodipyrimidine photo-lyase [Erysipelotrichaceae bacterium]
MKHVVYWISRALRIIDNQALFAAQQEAIKHKEPLLVFFNLYADFPHANTRNMDFLLKGLAEVSLKLEKLNIPALVMQGDVVSNLDKLNQQVEIRSIFTEHQVLRPVRVVHERVGAWAFQNRISFTKINTACVIPVWITSPKLEYSAKTIRNKIMNQYIPYLEQTYPLVSHPYPSPIKERFTINDAELILSKNNWKQLSLSTLKPGEDAANEVLDDFIKNRLQNYDRRNEIDSQGQSHLSAYLHFGMLSPLKMIRTVKETNHPNAALFIEEAMVRRELAENYCFYQEHYDSLIGAWSWAQATLNTHRLDQRTYLYTLEDFENARTHDELWNTCQKMVVEDGYLHSYLRMYWAKMVLFWSESPEAAIKILIHLNDTYFLDGRDPNGYTGIMWSVAAVHDRPWFDKPVHGLVRAMGKDGTLKKTKIKL